MFLTRTLCCAFIFGTVLLSSATAAPKPMVFGYLAQENSSALTINGSKELDFQADSKEQQLQLNQDLDKLCRHLNQIAQNDGFDPENIIPVIQNDHYEIRYNDQTLLRIKSSWTHVYASSKLNTLLKLTNILRQKMGAPSLTRFSSLKQITAHQTGLASWYGGHFQGRLTANGEHYDIHQLTAAHKHLPFGTKVLVTNLDTQQSVMVKINDRGPFKPKRIIDLSPAAFEKIGYLGQGVLRVKITILS